MMRGRIADNARLKAKPADTHSQSVIHRSQWLYLRPSVFIRGLFSDEVYKAAATKETGGVASQTLPSSIATPPANDV